MNWSQVDNITTTDTDFFYECDRLKYFSNENTIIYKLGLDCIYADCFA